MIALLALLGAYFVCEPDLSRRRRQAPRATRAAALLAQYPEGLALNDLLERVCRDEGINVLAADLWDVAGVMRWEASRWCIYLSRQDAPHRQQLALAHLLGHYFLHAASKWTFVFRTHGQPCGAAWWK